MQKLFSIFSMQNLLVYLGDHHETPKKKKMSTDRFAVHTHMHTCTHARTHTCTRTHTHTHMHCDSLTAHLAFFHRSHLFIEGWGTTNVHHMWWTRLVCLLVQSWLKWERPILQLSHGVCCFRVFHLRRFLTIFLEEKKIEIIFGCVCVLLTCF